MSQAANPYAPPTARVDDAPGANPEAEAIRRAHISTEASIKAVGVLYYLGGAFFLLVAILPLFSVRQPPSFGITLILFALGAAQIAGGWALRALVPWGRIVACIFSVLGLLAFPIGTVINAYILYLLWSKKGSQIFRSEYPAVIAAAPHVKYRTPIASWIVLALFLALFVYLLLRAFAGW